MGRLNRIEQIVNSTVNHYAHVKVFPRGLPRFVDSSLRGSVRFGKRTGNTISLLSPDNTYLFEEAPQARDNKFTLNRFVEWIIPDCILSIGPERELHHVDDVVDNTVILKSSMTQTYTLDDKVLLHSYPMLTSVDINPGDDYVVVKSRYPLANGDVFAYLQSDALIQSLTEIQVVNSINLGTTSSPFYTYLYGLQLSKPIERNFSSNSTVYIRAYPAYFSYAIRVPPALFTSEPIGPFLIDLIGGGLLEGKEYEEILALKTLNRAGAYLLGSSTEYVTIEKNHAITYRPVPAHAPMFWELAEGSMRMTPTKIVFKVDPNKNVFCAGIKCVPHLPPGQSWKINLTSNDDCTIRFIFHPHDPQEFSLSASIPKNVTISMPPGSDITDIEINILSASGICETYMSDWTPVSYSVEQLEYSYVIQATGIATYQTSGLVIKPFFLGSEFLKTSYDIGANYDSGKIYF